MENTNVLIIAEAGVNHNGDLETAFRMVDVALEAGADYIKFQTAKPELVISRFAPKAKYQEDTTGREESQLEMCKAIHLPLSDYKILKSYCDEKGIRFVSTPFDLVSIDVLEELEMDFYKIPSGEITNLPYLRKIAATGRPVILSTGMCELGEIAAALDVLTQGGIPKSCITLLHCNTQYPTPMQDVNLKAMQTLADEFGVAVGYSDHTVGIEVPVAAVAMGATVIEKHFTLDKNLPGPDHRASLDPAELKQMVQSIRHIEQALGSGRKEPSPSELPNLSVARKSIVAVRDIQKGELLTELNITCKRPGDGISPMEWDRILDTKASRDFKADEKIVE